MFTQTGAAAADRLIVIEGGWQSLLEWCAQCQAVIEMIPSEDFAAQSNVSLQAVQHLLDRGAFHGAHDAGGRLLICPNSPLRIVPRSRVGSPPPARSFA